MHEIASLFRNFILCVRCVNQKFACRHSIRCDLRCSFICTIRENTIEEQARVLQEQEAVVSQHFRRDILNKIRRQSVRAISIKDKLGVGHKQPHRPKSLGGPFSSRSR